MKVASCLAAVALSVLLAPCASGQVQTKLLASDGAGGDCFGVSVSFSGDTAIVGALYDNDLGSSSGSAYIFEKVSGVWTQQAKLLASDGATDDLFGRSVSISGDTAIVGGELDDDLGNWSGSTYVFEKVGGVWTQQAKLLASDGAADDRFGISVSISGDTALVGAYQDDDLGEDSGSAYIFKEVGGVWTQTAKLLASDGAARDWFGYSVSICGDTAIVGAIYDNDPGADRGSAYIFQKVGGVWTQTVKLRASDGAARDMFGESVSISGDTAIVGAMGDDEYRGSAYIFEKVGGVWMQQAKLLASDGAGGERFGESVSISGDTAIVGAEFDDDLGNFSGAAYVYEKVGGAWTQTAKLLASDGAADDWFGISVSISGDTAIVGACGDDDLGFNSGSAYAFEWACNAADFVPPFGTLNFFDVQAFLNCFAGNDMRADLTGDSVCDFFDVQMFLDAYAAGCP